MSARHSSLRLPRALFWLTLGVAALLVGLVILSPLVHTGKEDRPGWFGLLPLFAHDATVRRTMLASAVGLMVTACVFFRAEVPGRGSGRKVSRLPPPPPRDVVGA